MTILPLFLAQRLSNYASFLFFTPISFSVFYLFLSPLVVSFSLCLFLPKEGFDALPICLHASLNEEGLSASPAI